AHPASRQIKRGQHQAACLISVREPESVPASRVTPSVPASHQGSDHEPVARTSAVKALQRAVGARFGSLSDSPGIGVPMLAPSAATYVALSHARHPDIVFAPGSIPQLEPSMATLASQRLKILVRRLSGVSH